MRYLLAQYPRGNGAQRKLCGRLRRFCASVGLFMILSSIAHAQVVINEVDADQSGTDMDEYIELFGPPNLPLDAYVLVFYNGATDTAYRAFDLDGFFTDAGGYFILCGDSLNVVNCDLDVAPDSNLLQNGADAVALYLDAAASFPNGTAVTNANLVDAIVYDTGEPDAITLIATLTPGSPQVDESGLGNGGQQSNQRCPNGSAALDSSTFVQAPPTPGLGNNCAYLVINEVLADQKGGDQSEFVEVFGFPSSDYSRYSILQIEGDLGASPGMIDSVLPVGLTNSAGYFISGFLINQIENGSKTLLLVEDFFGVAGDDIDVDNDGLIDVFPWLRLVDSIAISDGGGGDFVYSSIILAPGFDGDPSTPGGASRLPNGVDTDAVGDWTRNDYTVAGLPGNFSTFGTGGALNTPQSVNRPPDTLFINEVDADTAGIDTMEFIELYDQGQGNSPLDGVVLVFYNGNTGITYGLPIDLNGFSTDNAGYFVIGNAAVAGVDLVIGDASIQNGADALALYVGHAADFPLGSFLDTRSLLDALVYDTNDADIAILQQLLLPGQPQVNEGANGLPASQSSQRCPDGGDLRVTDTYFVSAPTPGLSNCGSPFFDAEIFEIQGTGLNTPLDGQTILTRDNIVTAVGTNGFIMQTPDSRDDFVMDSSNGVYVYLGAAPSVNIGDQVDVVGTASESFGSTQMSFSPLVSLDSSGNPLPTAFDLGPNVPSPNPASPACTAGRLECLESMLVNVTTGIVSESNQSFAGDAIAELSITAGGVRPFREPGINFPGLAGLPEFDGNPEILELDIDRLGLPNPILIAGSTFFGFGVIGFEFGDYEFWPTSLTITSTPVFTPVRTRIGGEMTIGSVNLFRLFNDIDDPGPEDDGNVLTSGAYQTRLIKLSAYIGFVMRAPDVVAIQEAENLSVLEDLSARILLDNPGVSYNAFLLDGNDVGGIDVGFLVRSGVILDSVMQMGATELLSVDGSLLHDRPPLLLQGRYTGNGADFPFALMVNHTRSRNGIDDAGTSGQRVRQKRLEQAQSIAQKAQDFQTTNPTVPLVVIGDFNNFEFTDGYVDVVGQVAGDAVAADNELFAANITNPVLTKRVLDLPPQARYSFVFEGSAQVLDHALTNVAADPFVRDFQFARGNADAAQDLINDAANVLRASDHDGLVLYVMTDRDADGVPDDVDNCPDDFNPGQEDLNNDGAGDACVVFVDGFEGVII